MFLPWAPRPRVARSAVVRLGAALWSVAACGDGARETPRTRVGGAPAATVRAAGVEITDDGGRVVRLATPARRVISLIPSATETLVALGAADRVVGRTRYDVAPEIASRPSVGGGLDPSVEAIVGLRPDVVIGWENDKRQAVRDGRVATVPANLANRPGPHLGEAARALRAALHPELAATAARSTAAGATAGARP